VETVCVKVKLKPGSLEQVHEWAEELRSRADEVLATLRDEGVAVESVFLDSHEQGDFLVYYMKARSLSAAREAAERSSHPIDAYHEQSRRRHGRAGALSNCSLTSRTWRRDLRMNVFSLATRLSTRPLPSGENGLGGSSQR
jgi:Family of unknown function (DUF6176)